MVARSISHRLLFTLVLATMLLAWPRPAAAHPLGNFTINLYSRIAVEAQRADLTYIVDMAEIPTYQEFGGSALDPTAQSSYLAHKAVELRDGLRLTVDGHTYALGIVSQAISFPQGQGGLSTTRVELRLAASLPAQAPDVQRSIAYEDTNFSDRLGWHEIVVQAANGVRIAQSDAPAVDVSNELRSYPDDMLANPLDLRRVQVRVVPGSSTTPAFEVAQAVASARPTNRFAALINVDFTNPLVFVLTLLAALGLGATHALSPGHGKTVVAAYLIGTRGTARHALFLGLTVTITHTLGVFVLGLITLYASRYVLPEQLYPWLGVISGTLVIGMGVTLFRQRVRAALHASRQHDHDHEHDHMHDHTHDHGHNQHEHGPHTHTHLPPGANGTAVTWQSLLALGVSGGLVPCPSALVVMLSAIAVGRIGMGLLMITVFSVGLAGVLTAIGLLFVYGGRWLQRMDHGRLHALMPGLRFVPILGALVVTTAGLLLTMQAAVQAGLLG